MREHYGSFDEMYACLRARFEPTESASAEAEEGKMKYRLNEVVTTPTVLYVQQTASLGRTKWGSVRLMPNKVYETDDEKLIESLRIKGYLKVAYNERLEERLKELGKEYSVELCKSCGGRVKKIKYHAVEILE